MGHNVQRQQINAHVFQPSSTKNWDDADIDSGCSRDPLHRANTPSWCGADIETKTDGPCSIADPKAEFSCLCAQTACPASKLGCYSQAPIRSLVRPALEYASPVWDGCPKRDSVALERIQLAVARAGLRCSRRDVSNTETLRRIGWPTLAWRRWRQKLSVLWDLLQQRGQPKLCDKVPRTAAQRCDYSLRNSSPPAIPLCRIFHRQNSILPASLSLFISLPASVTSCSCKPAFLSALDKYILPDKFDFGLS